MDAQVDFVLQCLEVYDDERLLLPLKLLKANLIKVIRQFSPIEKGYRELEMYFDNKGPDGATHVMNASWEELTDLDGERFIRRVGEFFGEINNRLDQSNAISCLIIPMYLRDSRVIKEYSKICDRYGISFFTDFVSIGSNKDFFLTGNAFHPAFGQGSIPIHYPSEMDLSNPHLSRTIVVADLVFKRPEYGFLYPVGVEVSLATALGAIMAKLKPASEEQFIEIGFTNYKIIRSCSENVMHFNTFWVQEKNGVLLIKGNKPLYAGDDALGRNVRLNMLIPWMAKKLVHYINFRIVEQIEVSPPGTLLNLQQELESAFIADFYRDCCEHDELFQANIKWLNLLPPCKHGVIGSRYFDISFFGPYLEVLLAVRPVYYLGEHESLIINFRLHGDSTDFTWEVVSGNNYIGQLEPQ